MQYPGERFTPDRIRLIGSAYGAPDLVERLNRLPGQPVREAWVHAYARDFLGLAA